MKKERQSKILAVAVLLFCVTLWFVSCSGCGDSGAELPTTSVETSAQSTEESVSALTRLQTPVVTLSGDMATWSADPAADKFEISINGNLSYIENSVTSRKLNAGEIFKIRAVGDGINFLTSEWSRPVTYQGETEETETSVLTFTVTWKNGESTLEVDEGVSLGSSPVYNGETPQKASDAQYDYEFSGWSPALGQVMGNVTYEAQFAAKLRSYKVEWMNGETLLKEEEVPYGETPVYSGDIPTKDATPQYTFTFDRWSPEISPVTQDVTYQAVFSEELRSYTLTFYAEDGVTKLDDITVTYGSDVTYAKDLPVKNPTEAYTYIFDKWVTTPNGDVADDLKNITEDRAVYASFKAEHRMVRVHIASNNTAYGTVSLSALDNIPYGSEIKVSGQSLIINGQTVTATATTSTPQYTYVFTGWSTVETVGHGTTVTANFDRILNTYTVTWKNGDVVLETDTNVPYGELPRYNGETPSKPKSDDFVYIFSGWSPQISTVKGDVTYEAQFTSSDNVHVVIFMDEDGRTELARLVVKNGNEATYPSATPTKVSTAQTVYTFDKWVTNRGGDVEADLSCVVKEMTVYAKYSESARLYTVTFRDWDGSEWDVQKVAYRDAAQDPGSPGREGYRFTGWSKNYDKITADVTLVAQYVRQYKVTFIDYNNSIISVHYVDINGKVVIANEPDVDSHLIVIAPSDVERVHYRFTGWNPPANQEGIVANQITADLTVKAQYVRQYKVTFLRQDGTVLNEICVDTGHSVANLPQVPALEGYTAVGWDTNLTSVTEDLTVRPIYKPNEYKVQFVMPDGTPITRNYCAECGVYRFNDEVEDGKCIVCKHEITLETEQFVKHGLGAIEPEPPKVFFDGIGEQKKIYSFTEWDVSFDDVTRNMTVKAKYETLYELPVIVLDVDDNVSVDANTGVSTSIVTIHIYNQNTTINAIEFVCGYHKEGISMVDIQIIPGRFDPKEDPNGENHGKQYVVNNNEQTFTWAWADTNGQAYSAFIPVMTLTFNDTEINEVEFDIETFIVEHCAMVISDSDGGNLEKIIPVVIYQSND